MFVRYKCILHRIHPYPFIHISVDITRVTEEDFPSALYAINTGSFNFVISERLITKDNLLIIHEIVRDLRYC